MHRNLGRGIRLLALSFLLLGASDCQNALKYEDDIRFDNSAVANSFEHPLWVDGKVCKDMDGRVGSCVKSVTSDSAIHLNMVARPYAYNLKVECSSSVDSNLSIDVLPGVDFEWTIEPEKFSGVRLFSCIGEVFPKDRANSLSSKWYLRILVVDKNYDSREEIYRSKEYLVLGAYAKYSVVCTERDCKQYEKRTAIKDDGIIWAFSESEMLRFNTYGL